MWILLVTLVKCHHSGFCQVLQPVGSVWISLDLDSDICHLAFPFSLVSTCLNMSEPVSQPNPDFIACRHVYGSQDVAKGTSAHAHTLLSCEVRWGHLEDPLPAFSLKPRPCSPQKLLFPLTPTLTVWVFPSSQSFPGRRCPRPTLAPWKVGGKKRKRILTSWLFHKRFYCPGWGTFHISLTLMDASSLPSGEKNGHGGRSPVN